MSLNVFASSGGGIRIGASFGAEWEGERQGKFHPDMFNCFVGTSAGALDAALTANGWTAQQKKKLFLETDFARLFTPLLMPFGWRKALALKWPISLEKLAVFIDGLGLKPTPHLFVNSVDAEQNVQVVYCEELPAWLHVDWDPVDGCHYSYRRNRLGEKVKSIRWEPRSFSRLGFGKVLTRSMVLPGLVADDRRYKDGGVAENPLLSIFPENTNMLLMHLGYAGLVEKKGTTIPIEALDEALYAYEFKAFSFAEHLMEHYGRLTVIYPKIYDVDSTKFNLSAKEKQLMFMRAAQNTQDQWDEFTPF